MNLRMAEPQQPIDVTQLKAAVEALGLDYDGGKIRAIHITSENVVVETEARTADGDAVGALESIVLDYTVHPILY